MINDYEIIEYNGKTAQVIPIKNKGMKLILYIVGTWEVVEEITLTK